jgi:hypothetical protein
MDSQVLFFLFWGVYICVPICGIFSIIIPTFLFYFITYLIFSTHPRLPVNECLILAQKSPTPTT